MTARGFRKRGKRRMYGVALALVAPLAFGIALGALTNPNILQADWRTANRASAGIAPTPAEAPEAIVQLWSARAFSWRGIFSVHTWIAIKPRGADEYRIMEALGWRALHDRSVVVIRRDLPDRFWFNSPPQLVAERRGAVAEAAIPRLLTAAADYPYRRQYGLWPGPNSNTFTAWLLRQLPELGFAMPANALGKDYLGATLWAPAPSGTGYQISLGGALGVLAAREEGLELNLLGLTFGIDASPPALLLPGIGRLGGG